MATELHRIATLETRSLLQELNNNFCYFLDHGMLDELVDLFTEDAEYIHGSRHSNGREEIRAVFDKREAVGPRTARHMQTGLRLKIEGEKRAFGDSVCMTFAANALPPITPAEPYLIADFIDEYQLCADGQWRIAKRRIDRIFMSPVNAGPVGQS